MRGGILLASVKLGGTELLSAREGMPSNQILLGQIQTLRLGDEHHGEMPLGSSVTPVFDQGTPYKRSSRRTDREMGTRAFYQI